MSDTFGHDVPWPWPTGDGRIVVVIVNGRRMQVGANISVATLLESLGYPDRGVAVALNRSVLPRSDWQTSLSDGACLDVLAAVQGG
jgi:sulfur carrier protein